MPRPPSSPTSAQAAQTEQTSQAAQAAQATPGASAAASRDHGPGEPTHRVRIEATGQSFDARADATLLASAAAAGLDFPNSCRNGTCRTCMARLRSGEVAYRIAWPGLLAEEKADGWILPCVAYPRSDLVIREFAVH